VRDRIELAAQESAPAEGIDPNVLPKGLPGVEGALPPEQGDVLAAEGII
jgi:hypothetical protein